MAVQLEHNVVVDGAGDKRPHGGSLAWLLMGRATIVVRYVK